MARYRSSAGYLLKLAPQPPLAIASAQLLRLGGYSAQAIDY
ncbi:MAG: hypothetical protein OJI67_18585 [Prosthecobacter sp.]|nr:hypothetical protein [Prosthecobacter sp.]